jgi:hypothetical protein
MKITLTKTWTRDLEGTEAIKKAEIERIANKEKPDRVEIISDERPVVFGQHK